jgi:hypothetical protein
MVSLIQTEKRNIMIKKTNSPAVAAAAAADKIAVAEAAKRLKTANSVMTALTDVRAEFQSANNEFENATEKLYRTLSRIYEQFVVLKNADKETLKVFNQKVDELKMTKNKATPLATKLLRVVAEDKLNENRLKSYSKCFQFAFENKNDADSFTSFIMSFGGIDYVRRAASESDKDSDKKPIDVNATRTRLNAASALMSISQKARKSMLVESKKSSRDEQFYVALVRKDNNEVVALADSKASVNATIKYEAKKDADAAKPKDVKTIDAKTGEEVSAEEAAAQLNSTEPQLNEAA